MEKFGTRELEFNRWLYLFGGGATRDPRQGQPGLTAAQCPVPLQTWRDSGRLSGRALREWPRAQASAPGPQDPSGQSAVDPRGRQASLAASSPSAIQAALAAERYVEADEALRRPGWGRTPARAGNLVFQIPRFPEVPNSPRFSKP